MPVHLRDLLRAESTKDQSRLKILHTIMARAGTQAYLARRSGLSAGTVSDAVKELANSGFVLVAEKDGRSKPVTLARTTGAAVGIELGFHNSAVVARRVEQSYDQATVRLCSVGAASRQESWLEDVAQAVRDAVDDLGEDDIVAVGLGVPRMVDPHTGKLVPPVLPPWKEGDDPAQMLADELSRRVGQRLLAPTVVLDNDANLAAYAQSIYEFDQAETLIGIKASTGIGAGIVVGGKIFRGARGAAGEIGHVVVQPGGKFCTCGGRGCLESVIGADALIEQVTTTLGHRRLKSPETLDALVQMAKDGNVGYQRVLREAAATLGFAIGNLCNILNPNVVVLGGAFGRDDATPYTVEPCVAAIRQSAMQATVDDAGSRGVAVHVTKIQHPAAHGALVLGLEGTKYGRASSGTARSSQNRSR